jgi:Zn-dependent M28 family amino/carboxypeptidase
LLEIAEALALNPPRRSVIFASFCAEEDGLIGSREFCANLPVDAKNIVCMVNLDQIGVGPTKQTSVLGTAHNPQLSAVLARAKQLGKTGITKIHHGRRKELGQSIKLFERSDHFEFHRIGIPAIFFFEGLPLSSNKDYHTWRDTVEGVDLAKTTSTAKLVYNTIWILANDDARPPKPRD